MDVFNVYLRAWHLRIGTFKPFWAFLTKKTKDIIKIEALYCDKNILGYRLGFRLVLKLRYGLVLGYWLGCRPGYGLRFVAMPIQGPNHLYRLKDLWIGYLLNYRNSRTILGSTSRFLMIAVIILSAQDCFCSFLSRNISLCASSTACNMFFFFCLSASFAFFSLYIVVSENCGQLMCGH